VRCGICGAVDAIDLIVPVFTNWTANSGKISEILLSAGFFVRFPWGSSSETSPFSAACWISDRTVMCETRETTNPNRDPAYQDRPGTPPQGSAKTLIPDPHKPTHIERPRPGRKPPRAPSPTAKNLRHAGLNCCARALRIQHKTYHDRSALRGAGRRIMRSPRRH